MASAGVRVDRGVVPSDGPTTYNQARRLAWWTVAYLVMAGFGLWVVLSGSQALEAAWLETVFSIASPIVFLLGGAVEHRPADRRFPFGYHRFVSIAFLGAAVALFTLGLWLVWYTANQALGDVVAGPLGSTSLFGMTFWARWLTVAILLWAAVPAFLIGRVQRQRATILHDKVLVTDAKLRQADWLTALAAGLALVAIEAGWPRLDLVAAAFIAATVLWAGWQQLRHALKDLADSAPTTVEDAVDPLPERLTRLLRDLPWVRDADVRLREEGRMIFGEILLVLRDEDAILDRVAETVIRLKAEDWRLHSLTIMPVRALPDATVGGGLQPAPASGPGSGR